MAAEPATRQLGSGHAGPQPATDTLFEERRGFTRTFVGLGLCMAGGLAWGYTEYYGFGLDVRTGGFVLGAGAFLGLFVVVFALAPGTSEYKSIRVDRSGLTLGRQFLPAGEVGRCELLPEPEAGRAALRCRYQDIRIGRRKMSYNYLPNNGPAVFVIQTRKHLGRPGWLIASADPEGLLAALAELRSDVVKPVW